MLLLLSITPGCAAQRATCKDVQMSVSGPSGPVLFVLSAAPIQRLSDGSQRKTGYFLNELYEAYESVHNAGYEVLIATPDGRSPVVDPESLNPKYWSHPEQLGAAQAWITQDPRMLAPMSLKDAWSQADALMGIVVPGGQGVMVDLLEELYIETFVMGAKAQNRKIGAQLQALGFDHDSAFPGRANAVRDCNLVTSQNPFSGEQFSARFLEALDRYRGGGRCRCPGLAQGPA